jgi:undecaprenyl pyrophosphate synthase
MTQPNPSSTFTFSQPQPCPSYLGIIPDGNARHLKKNPNLKTYQAGGDKTTEIINEIASWVDPSSSEYVKGVVLYGLSSDNKSKRGEAVERVVLEQVRLGSEKWRSVRRGVRRGARVIIIHPSPPLPPPPHRF